MQLRKWAVGFTLLSMIGTGVIAVAADEPKGDAPKDAPKHAHHGKEIPKPYSQLGDLTDDQKAKIVEIHKAEVEAVKKLEEQQKADILAVLTDDQKTELTELEAKSKLEAKADKEAAHAREHEHKADDLRHQADQTPTTAPSGDAGPK